MLNIFSIMSRELEQISTKGQKQQFNRSLADHTTVLHQY